MTTYETVLAGREEIAASTMAFHFRKPAGLVQAPARPSISFSIRERWKRRAAVTRLSGECAFRA